VTKKQKQFYDIDSRLHAIFRDVEKEFEALYIENVQLRDRVSALERANQVC
jgi:hypothetical protein